jgi:HEAT repeat protein
MMRSLRWLVISLCLLGLGTPTALAAETPPPPAENPEKEGGDAPKEGEENPEEKPAEGPSADLLKIWENIKDAFLSGSEADKIKAVNRMIDIKAQKGLAALLAKAINACRGYPTLQIRLAEKLTEISDPEAVEWVRKVLAAEAGKKKNASSQLVALYIDFLIKNKTEQVTLMSAGILPNLAQPGFLFSVLFNSGEAPFIEIVGKYAAEKKNPAVLRRQAIDYLGKWWSGKPCFGARVPHLIRCMEIKETVTDARTALQNICMPKYRTARRWKKWWEPFSEKEDLDIIWECFRDAYERVSGRQKRKDGAREIIEYIRDWSNPLFAWSLPILHKALIRFEDKELKEEILYKLGKIRSQSSLEVVLELLRSPEGSAPNIQAQIAKSLGSIAPTGNPTAGEALMEMHEGTMSISVKREIYRSLGKIRYKKAINLLIEVLKDDSSDRRNWTAAEALGEMKAIEALPTMVTRFQETEDRDLQLYILRAFRKMGVKTEEVYSIAVIGLDSEDFRIQDAAILLLGDLKDKRAVTNLKRVFQNNSARKKTRQLALDALAYFPSKDVFEIFIEALKIKIKEEHQPDNPFGKKHQLNEINKKAVEYFEKDDGKNFIPEMLDPLLDLVQDRKANGRLKALVWIRRPVLWNPKSAPSVMIALFHPTEDDLIVKETVANLLTHPHKDTVEPLIKKFSGGMERYAWVDYQIAFILRRYVQMSNLSNPDNPLESVDFGTNKKSWMSWWRKNRSKFKLENKSK